MLIFLESLTLEKAAILSRLGGTNGKIWVSDFKMTGFLAEMGIFHFLMKANPFF